MLVIYVDLNELEKAIGARNPDLLGDKTLVSTIKWIMLAQRQGASVLLERVNATLAHMPKKPLYLE